MFPLLSSFLLLISRNLESLAVLCSALLVSLTSSPRARSCAGGVRREFVSVSATAALPSLVPGYIVAAALAASLHGDSGDGPTGPSYQSTSHRRSAQHLQAPILFSREGKAVTIFNLPSVS